MPEARSGVDDSAVSFRQNVVLFVEGTQGSLDVDVLRTLLSPLDIRVEPLGPAFSLVSAAQALKQFHPHYYFVIDRDARSNDDVDRFWREFGDPEKTNLAIWRKRHLESYFLDPDYLSNSPYLKDSVESLRKRTIDCAGRRVFLDLTNSVIEAVREHLRRSERKLLTNPKEIASIDQAWEAVRSGEHLTRLRQEVADLLSEQALRRVFEEKRRLFFGTSDSTDLRWGQGQWLECIDAKKILHEVIGPCFRVEDTGGNVLQGPEKLQYVARSLLRRPRKDQPEDFQALYHAMERAKREYRP